MDYLGDSDSFGCFHIVVVLLTTNPLSHRFPPPSRGEQVKRLVSVETAAMRSARLAEEGGREILGPLLVEHRSHHHSNGHAAQP